MFLQLMNFRLGQQIENDWRCTSYLAVTREHESETEATTYSSLELASTIMACDAMKSS